MFTDLYLFNRILVDIYLTNKSVLRYSYYLCLYGQAKQKKTDRMKKLLPNKWHSGRYVVENPLIHSMVSKQKKPCNWVHAAQKMPIGLFLCSALVESTPSRIYIDQITLGKLFLLLWAWLCRWLQQHYMFQSYMTSSCIEATFLK